MSDLLDSLKSKLGPRIRQILPASDLERHVNTFLLDCVGDSEVDEFLPDRRLACPGIDFEVEAACERLRSLAADADASSLAGLLAAIRTDPSINTIGTAEGIHNGFFSTPDVEVYAAMITLLKPRQIVEVGAGFSTRVASRAIAHLGLECGLTAIDPEPRADLAGLGATFIPERVENVAVSRLLELLGEGTILFIDSSHVCKTRGDVDFLFGELLPLLPAGTVVHVDDIYLPFEYPEVYRRRMWSEQLVLHSTLSHSSRYEVLMPVHLIARDEPETLRLIAGDEAGRSPQFMGASFWFRVREVA